MKPCDFLTAPENLRTGFNLAPYPSLTCAHMCLWNHNCGFIDGVGWGFLDYTPPFQIPRKSSRSLARAAALQKESVASAFCWENYPNCWSKGVWSTVLIFRSWHAAEVYPVFYDHLVFKNNWGLTENRDEDEHWSFIFNTPKLNWPGAFHEWMVLRGENHSCPLQVVNWYFFKCSGLMAQF